MFTDTEQPDNTEVFSEVLTSKVVRYKLLLNKNSWAKRRRRILRAARLFVIPREPKGTEEYRPNQITEYFRSNRP